MPKHERYQNRIELLQGTLDTIQATRAGSCDVFLVESGSLYPALHRLEEIKAEWRTSEHNQRQLAAAVKRQLTNEHSRWNRMSAAIANLMNPGESERQA